MQNVMSLLISKYKRHIRDRVHSRDKIPVLINFSQKKLEVFKLMLFSSRKQKKIYNFLTKNVS